jgi:hypothetical protein
VKIEKLMHDFLAEKLNGGLFAYIEVRVIGNEIGTQVAYYTVQEGIVYEINKDGTLINSEDELQSVESQLIRIGEYEQGKAYPLKNAYCSFNEFLNQNKLN